MGTQRKSSAESYHGYVNPVGQEVVMTKARDSETLCSDYQRIHTLDIRIMRIFNTYGPRMKANDGRVVSNLICQALQNKPLTIYGMDFKQDHFVMLMT